MLQGTARLVEHDLDLAGSIAIYIVPTHTDHDLSTCRGMCFLVPISAMSSSNRTAPGASMPVALPSGSLAQAGAHRLAHMSYAVQFVQPLLLHTAPEADLGWVRRGRCFVARLFLFVVVVSLTRAAYARPQRTTRNTHCEAPPTQINCQSTRYCFRKAVTLGWATVGELHQRFHLFLVSLVLNVLTQLTTIQHARLSLLICALNVGPGFHRLLLCVATMLWTRWSLPADRFKSAFQQLARYGCVKVPASDGLVFVTCEQNNLHVEVVFQ